MDAFTLPAQFTYGNGGRNILRGDNLMQVDVSLLKQSPITETKRLELRAEFFNLGNHPVFGNPGTAIIRILEFASKMYF